MKNDEDKYRPTLIFKTLIDQVSRVRMYGIKKYGAEDDWRTTEPCYTRHLDAALRHLYAIADGETFDKDSGFAHTALAVANLMFIIQLESEGYRADGTIEHSMGDSTIVVENPKKNTISIISQLIEHPSKWR